MQMIQGHGLDLVIDELRRLRYQSADAQAATSIAASLIRGRFARANLAETELAGNAVGANEETAGATGSPSSSAVLPGQSDLASAVENRRAYFRSVAQIGVQAASALAYAHARGVVHRDIKPSNLLLDTAGVVWVTDFGLAKTSESGMTVSGDIVGTVRYIAPERFRGQCDMRADLYALGLPLYELLTLRPAFASDDRLQLIEQIRRDEPATPRSMDRKVPRDLETLVLKAIDKDPRRRYQSADELGADLQRFLAGEPVQARRIGLPERALRWVHRNPAVTAMTVAVLVAMVVGGLGFSYWLQQRQAGAARLALALSEATLLRDQAMREPEDLARWRAAREGVQRAQSALAEAGDRASRQRLAALDSQVRAGAQAADRDHVLLEQLIDIPSAKADDPDGSATDTAYSEAFRAAEIDDGGMDAQQAGARIAARPESVRRAIVAALDHWTIVRRKRQRQGKEWRKLVAVARAADPDPVRDTLRAALAVENKVQLLERIRPLVERARSADWSPASLVLLGNTLADAGDVDAGVRVLRRAAGVHPTDVWVQYTLGNLLMRMKPPRRDEAIAAHTAARAIAPELGQELAHELQRSGQGEQAEAVFRDLVRCRPLVARHLTCLGDYLQRRGRADEARLFLERAVAASRETLRARPRDRLAHYNLGLTLNYLGELEEAIAVYRKAIELDPKLAAAHNRLGNALLAKGQMDGAIACFRKAIALDPKLVGARSDLGGALWARGQSDEAFAILREAITIDPKHAASHNAFGVVLYTFKRDYDGAVVCLRTAVALDPKVASAHNNLGSVLLAKGQIDEAIACFRKAIDLDAKYPLAHNNLANALAGKGQLNQAIACYQKTIELDPKNVAARTRLAEAQRLAAVREKVAAFREGSYTPVSNEERLGLVGWCQNQKLHRTLTRLYADAFAADPKLADDLVSAHRYNAAGFAALAAAGQGADAAELDDEEHALLRKQALDWLRADLAARTKQMETGKPPDRAKGQKELHRWQDDAKLAGVRNREVLAQLPEGERSQWQALWAEVQALIDGAGKEDH